MDGVEIVSNPAEPVHPPVTYDMKELWRLRSEAEDGSLVFGMISDVEVDSLGNVYLLDTLLMTIHVLSPDGEYLRSISQEGEGPGDLRSANDLFIDSEGNALVAEYDAARISFFTNEGLPLRLWEPDRVDSAFVRPRGVNPVPGGLAVECRSLRPQGNQATLRYFCGIFDHDGHLQAKLFERRLELDRVLGITFKEAQAERIWCWTADSRGWVYVAPEFSEYRILCFDDRGVHRMTIEREHELVLRTQEEMEEELSILEAECSAFPNTTCTVERHHRAVTDVSRRDGGALWVRTSAGWNPANSEIAMIIDEFDEDGVFDRQILLRGRIDPREDSIRIHGNRCYRLTWIRGSYMSALSADTQATRLGGVAGIPEVVCYEMESAQ